MALSVSDIINFQSRLDAAAGPGEYRTIWDEFIAYLSGAMPADVQMLESVLEFVNNDLAHVIKRLIAFLKNTPANKFAENKKLVWEPDASTLELPRGKPG